MKITTIKKSVDAYENWLRKQLDGGIVEVDLHEKHDKMADDAFVYLRATYWRWAETVFDVCGGFKKVPKVLAIGDVHLENFGTWRDAEGRLVWGANDFDEAAEMPYTLDVIRLATSALLARKSNGISERAICNAILTGYRNGLEKAQPIVLDQNHPWLRKIVEVSEEGRDKFWRKMTPENEAKEKEKRKKKGHVFEEPRVIPRRLEKVLERALPTSSDKADTWDRAAGTGSLGRPRWVTRAMWRQSLVLREAKAVVQSAWSRIHDPRDTTLKCGQIARGRFRSPDPWYRLSGAIVVRRLSPNNRKIEIDDEPLILLDPQMLEPMGFEIANVHRGTRRVRAAIQKDLDRRGDDWLHAAATEAAAFVKGEHAEWQSIWGERKPKSATRKKRRASAP